MARAIGFEIKKCLLAVVDKEGKKEENGVKEEIKEEKSEIKEEVAGSSSG